MKKGIILGVAMATVLPLAACGSSGNEETTTSTETTVAETTTQETTTIAETTAASGTLTYDYYSRFSITYPSSYTYSDDYGGRIKNEDLGVTISLDNFSETLSGWKSTFEGESYTSSEGYSLVETTLGGHPAVICTYSDSMSYYKRVEVDLEGSFPDEPNAVTAQIFVSGDKLEDINDYTVTDIINSFEVLK